MTVVGKLGAALQLVTVWESTSVLKVKYIDTFGKLIMNSMWIIRQTPKINLSLLIIIRLSMSCVDKPFNEKLYKSFGSLGSSHIKNIYVSFSSNIPVD